MVTVAIITLEQAKLLENQEWCPDNYFAPVKISETEFIISEQEVKGNLNENFIWVNNLELSNIKYLSENNKWI